jgi:hypothetical protein
MPAAGAAEFAPRPPERSPFVARDWTGNVPVPSSSQGSVPAASSPWWHQPVLADLLPGGRIRDLCAVVLACGLLAAFRVPTTSSVALHIAEVSVVLFLGLTLGFRRGGLALVAYGAAALGGVKILPGQVSATVRDLTFGYLLQLATLLLFAAAAARLGGVGKRPVLGFVVAFAACVAGEGVAVAWTAHLLSGISFLTLWRQTEGVAAVYRDAGISAVCSVGLAFGGMWLATRRAGPGA